MSTSSVRRVAVIGPECTGKSALSAELASFYETVWVREFAREYIGNLDRPYNEPDLLTIARGQIQLEDQVERSANKLLICDTNLYVIKVWSKFKFSRVHPEILRMIDERRYDLYLLTNIDIPWVQDPQREHPDRREELFEIYLHEMKQQPVPFEIIEGTGNQRYEIAVGAVTKMLESL
jgi:NadR type nicotinamide-nucleotide adenylyltransferase